MKVTTKKQYTIKLNDYEKRMIEGLLEFAIDVEHQDRYLIYGDGEKIKTSEGYARGRDEAKKLLRKLK